MGRGKPGPAGGGGAAKVTGMPCVFLILLFVSVKEIYHVWSNQPKSCAVDLMPCRRVRWVLLYVHLVREGP